MRLLPLFGGRYKAKHIIDFSIVDDVDYLWAVKYEWNRHPGAKTYYASRMVGPVHQRRSIHLHREILSMKIGRSLLTVEDTDHVNRDGLDNMRDNLRVATRSQNVIHASVRRGKLVPFRGVKHNGSGFKASIKVGGIYLSLGTHRQMKDAARAYDKAAVAYHGEFAVLNFPAEWGL